PIRDGVLDAVGSFGGLHLYPDVPKAIAEMRRVLTPGGRVGGLTFRSHRDPLSRALEALAQRSAGVTGIDMERLSGQFAAHGFADFRAEGRLAVGYFTARG